MEAAALESALRPRPANAPPTTAISASAVTTVTPKECVESPPAFRPVTVTVALPSALGVTTSTSPSRVTATTAGAEDSAVYPAAPRKASRSGTRTGAAPSVSRSAGRVPTACGAPSTRWSGWSGRTAYTEAAAASKASASQPAPVGTAFAARLTPSGS